MRVSPIAIGLCPAQVGCQLSAYERGSFCPRWSRGFYRDLSPERIKRQLRRLCTTGYDLGAMVNRSRARGLYEAAVRHFGSWRDALVAAGVILTHVTNRRSKHLDHEPTASWRGKVFGPCAA